MTTYIYSKQKKDVGLFPHFLGATFGRPHAVDESKLWKSCQSLGHFTLNGNSGYALTEPTSKVLRRQRPYASFTKAVQGHRYRRDRHYRTMAANALTELKHKPVCSKPEHSSRSLLGLAVTRRQGQHGVATCWTLS